MTSPTDSDWLHQANAMQAELTEARSRLLQTEVTGTSGPVTVTLGATGDLRDIRIEADRLPEVASLRRDILAAHERAATAIRAMAQDMIRPLQELIGGLEQGGM